MADTMIRFTDNKLSEKFLSNEELMARCPHAFKDEPTNPNVSGKYVQANTMTVINDLAKLGWYPVEAKQCKAKKNSSGVRSFHMIALQNPDIKIMKNNADGTQTVDAYPRIIMTNSHDGFNSFKFMLGLVRMICSNGMVLCDETFANISVKHINYTFEELRLIIHDMILKISHVINTMNAMKSINLNEYEKKELASAVVKIRKGINDDEKIDIHESTIENILTPVRNEDKGNDLWSVFNVCQEKMIKGGFNVINNNKSRKQRGITSIKKDIECNQKLWKTAMNFLKAA